MWTVSNVISLTSFCFILIFSTNYAIIYKMMLLYANRKLYSNYLANIDYYWSNKKRKLSYTYLCFVIIRPSLLNRHKNQRFDLLIIIYDVHLISVRIIDCWSLVASVMRILSVFSVMCPANNLHKKKKTTNSNKCTTKPIICNNRTNYSKSR